MIGAIFWKRNDSSAKLWICACILSSIATFVTVHRSDIPLVFSYSLMVAFEAASVLIMGNSLQRLGSNPPLRISLTTVAIPTLLFLVVETAISLNNDNLTPQISAVATTIFGIGNVIALYQTQIVKKQFKNTLFFNFILACFLALAIIYLVRALNVFTGLTGSVFDSKTYNLIIWLLIILFATIRNLAYIVLRLHLGFVEHSRLNNMNIQLSNMLDERNKMILSLEKLNKSATVNAVASTIAHEINQPLGATKLNAQFAEMKLNSDPTNTTILKEIIQSILDDTNRASTIIKNISKFKSNKVNEISEVNLLESFNEVFEISKAKIRDSKISFDIYCSPELKININIGEWQQILINIINNAIEAVNELDGKTKEIKISVENKGAKIKITIDDSGPGVPVGQETKIFDLMVTNKKTGTGIGLWLTKNIIEKYAGEIFATNRAGGGARFTITLPTL